MGCKNFFLLVVFAKLQALWRTAKPLQILFTKKPPKVKMLQGAILILQAQVNYAATLSA